MEGSADCFTTECKRSIVRIFLTRPMPNQLLLPRGIGDIGGNDITAQVGVGVLTNENETGSQGYTLLVSHTL